MKREKVQAGPVDHSNPRAYQSAPSERHPQSNLEAGFSTVSDYYDDVARAALAELESVLSTADADTTLTMLPDGNFEATCAGRGVALHRTREGFTFQTLELKAETWVPVGKSFGYADKTEMIRSMVSYHLGL